MERQFGSVECSESSLGVTQAAQRQFAPMHRLSCDGKGGCTEGEEHVMRGTGSAGMQKTRQPVSVMSVKAVWHVVQILITVICLGIKMLVTFCM